MTENLPKQQEQTKKCKAKCRVTQNEDGQSELKLSIDPDSLPAHLKDEQEVQEYVFKQLMGTENSELAEWVLRQSADALPLLLSKEQRTKIILSSCQEMKPQDIVETRLCAKESVLYTLAMHYLRRAEVALDADCTSTLWHDSCMKQAIKLLKLHNETIETLNRYKRQGEQRVVVQHVNVADGGQAAFMSGNFNANTGGGGNQKNQGGTL